MQVKQWIFGVIIVKITSAEPNVILNYLSENNIFVSDVNWIDELTVEVTLPRKGYKLLNIIENRFHCEIKIIKNKGIMQCIKKLRSRPIFVFGMIFFLLLSIYIQNHILFVEVEGNNITLKRQILEYAEGYGLCIGVERGQLHSEQIKNYLLENLPQLQWVGINTSGCIVTINVRQRTEVATETIKDQTPASIIASRSGTICEIISSKGTVVCQVGQQVESGQTLISGMNKCGNVMLLTRAQGEVFANTQRNTSLISITPSFKRADELHSERRVSIIFRKKLINLYKGSGILGATCVKIRKNYNLRLPDNYILPLTICCEMIKDSSIITPDLIEEEHGWILEQGTNYILSQMVAGEIQNSTSTKYFDEEIIKYDVQYMCKEMIGQIKKEELFCLYGKNS